jgi:mono/diheme cytochrome c family protein
MTTQKLACPHCDVNLKIPGNLAGKRIKCPKCGDAFAVPDEDEPPARSRAVTSARPRKAPAPPPDDEEDEDEVQERRREPRRPRKKQKAGGGSGLLIVGILAGVGLLVAGGGVALAVVFWPSAKKTDPVAQNPMTAPMPMITPGTGPMPGPGGPGIQAATGPVDAGSGPFAAGRQVYLKNNCGRCHSVGGESGGRGGRGGRRTVDLSHIGANPSKTVEWIGEHIRNPKSHSPNSRMPGFGEDKISTQDLKALSEYLASLK